MEENRNQQGMGQTQTTGNQGSGMSQQGQQQQTGGQHNQEGDQNPQDGSQWNNYRTREMSNESNDSSQGNTSSNA
jgi:hypothetical protein